MPRFRWRVQQATDCANEYRAMQVARAWARTSGTPVQVVCVMDRDDKGVVTTAPVCTIVPKVELEVVRPS